MGAGIYSPRLNFIIGVKDMLKLKGKALERLSADKRARMERTLERMNEIRRSSDMRLAQLISGKKEWAEKNARKDLMLSKI